MTSQVHELELVAQLDIDINTFYDLTAATAITGLGSTSDGLVWSAPANAMECSFQYMITLDANPNISLTVDTNSVSFTDLSDSGFPICVRQDVTVTPVVPINDQILDGSGATVNLVFAYLELGM